MFISLSDVLIIFEQYRYLFIFPIAILEGPIITIISGFLVYLGLLNIYIIYILLVIGDLTGDAFHYAIGKYWRKSSWVKRYGHFLGYNEKSEESIENHFKKHEIKTVLSAKVLHGMGTAIQITAGIAGINFFRYIGVSLLGTIPKTLVLLLVGYYVGGSYIKIDGYLNTAAFITISVFLLVFLYFILNKIIRNFFVNNE
ncbi:MAG: VTT domain-containing protein [Candidatus Zambryskibacteria bacterium]|nr:VTT domain-containing protein [Candidatus Zambryskibacteria bacterium]